MLFASVTSGFFLTYARALVPITAGHGTIVVNTSEHRLYGFFERVHTSASGYVLR